MKPGIGLASTPPFRGRRGATFLAFLCLAAIAPAALPERSQARGCNKLPVKAKVLTKFGENYALQYPKKVPFYIETRGPTIRDAQVQLYTFEGFRLGRSRKLGDFSVGVKGRAKLKFPMQAGKYTLVVKGTVAGCGEVQLAKVVRFRDCRETLPLTFPGKPGGLAADYGAFLSIRLQTRGPVVRKLTGRVYSFDGEFYGRGKLRVLFGTAFLHNRLRKPLQAGGYAFVVEGRIDQPRECGTKSKTTTLKFK